MDDDTSRYHAFWGDFFGVEPARLEQPSISVVKHARLAGYPGVWFFACGSSCVVSAPDVWLEALRSRIDRIAAAPLPGPGLLRELFGCDPERVLGPTYQGWLPAGAFRAVRDREVRVLGPSDDPGLAELRSSCTSEEWDHSALSTSSKPWFGCFRDERLVAVAGLDEWSTDAGGPGVLSHPAYRGRGCGTAVVSAVVEQALAQNKLLLYQTPLEHEASVAIAARLGYRPYASHIAVRLQAEEP